jgi:hypothetical protein
LEESLSAKTAVLEELLSEKRILQAEREETLKRLISIQNDLEDVTTMEKKLVIEVQKMERDVHSQIDDEEYVRARGKNLWGLVQR